LESCRGSIKIICGIVGIKKSGFKSDDSNNSTPSGNNTTGGASKRVEEYLDGVKVATEADMSPPWELPEAIQVYNII
jgi:hypothetical protein